MNVIYQRDNGCNIIRNTEGFMSAQNSIFCLNEVPGNVNKASFHIYYFSSLVHIHERHGNIVSKYDLLYLCMSKRHFL